MLGGREETSVKKARNKTKDVFIQSVGLRCAFTLLLSPSPREMTGGRYRVKEFKKLFGPEQWPQTDGRS